MPVDMRPLLVFLSLTLLAGPAHAGETPWQEVAPGVTLRLISSGQVKADGTTLIGLEIDMPETTRTYWRVPGETGLPTELDFAGSTGIRSHRILWPYPIRHETADYLDYAYFGPTVLPVELTLEPGASGIELSAVLGICSDICVPAQARFSLPLDDAAPDRPNGLRIRQALAMTPMEWTADPQPLGDVELQNCFDLLAAMSDRPGMLVISGSLPRGVPDDFYARLVRLAKTWSKKVVLDTSGLALQAALTEGVYLIKPNLREFCELTGAPLDDEETWLPACRELITTGKAEIVALTLGHRGALLAGHDFAWRAPALPIKPVSTVGAGDCFVGAMVWALAGGADMKNAFRYGVAAGSAALLTPGTGLCTREDVERLYPAVRLFGV